MNNFIEFCRLSLSKYGKHLTQLKFLRAFAFSLKSPFVLGLRNQTTRDIEELVMTIAKVSEITSSSNKSFDYAIEKGIKRASKTIRGIQGAWIQDQKVVINDGKIVEYRINMKISFVLD
jgi:dodecin